MTYLHMWHIKEGEIIQIYLEYEACPEGIQPCIIKNTDIYWKRYKTQDTLYIGQWCLSPLQSRHLGISHNSPSHHQLPHHIFLVAFWIIRIVSAEECSSLMQNLMQIYCSTCSVIFNVMATQYTCSLNGIYCPHWLVQWSHHCSHMCIPVYSPWLPGYINVMQTLLLTINSGWTFSRQTLYIIHGIIIVGTQ